MGGALEVLGNVGFSGAGIENQVAEWNIYIDPLAAQRVFASGAPITLVPLDATNDAPVNLDFYRNLEANHSTPEAEFVYRILTDQLDFIASGGYSFWDPLAAALLVDESLAVYQRGDSEGVHSGRPEQRADPPASGRGCSALRQVGRGGGVRGGLFADAQPAVAIFLTFQSRTIKASHQSKKRYRFSGGVYAIR